MDLEIGDKLEERNRDTGELIGTHTIDFVVKKFAYAYRHTFSRQPTEPNGDKYTLHTTFRVSGICTKVSDCGGTCETCTCQ